MLPAKFGSIWPSSFRGEDLFNSSQSKKKLLLVAMFVGQMEPYEDAFWSILHRCFLPSLAPFGQAVSEEKIFLTLANQKKELLLVAIFVGQMEPNEDAL